MYAIRHDCRLISLFIDRIEHVIRSTPRSRDILVLVRVVRRRPPRALASLNDGFHVPSLHEIFHDAHVTVRVYISHALREHVRFGHPNRARERRDLSVDVCFAHVVEVRERERPDARSRQGFDRPRSDATESDD